MRATFFVCLLLAMTAGKAAAQTAEGHAPIELGPSPGEDLRQQRTATIGCLQEAESHYKSAWADACPGHSMFPCKTLPAYVAKPLTEQLDRERGFCFQAGAGGAGILGSATRQ